MWLLNVLLKTLFAESCGFMWCEEHTGYRHLRIRKPAEEALEEKRVHFEGSVFKNCLELVFKFPFLPSCVDIVFELTTKVIEHQGVPVLSSIFCILLVDYFSPDFIFIKTNKKEKPKTRSHYVAQPAF